jgi:2-oxoglutarate ferredoxin oxidoreductase subunit alpha
MSNELREGNKKLLMKGNEALAEAAIRAGCKCYFGYPITPQNEIPEYMSRRMPEVGGVFLQAESEIAAINMVFGASAMGARAMTSSSSPGISLKQEGISYLAGAELPAVIVNIQRGGPGLGNISASQADYFQAVKGGGHGDYRLLVYAPASVQEMVDLTIKGFDMADKYRNPVMILADGVLGQMMEPFEFKQMEKIELTAKTWALTGSKGREPNLIRSLYLKNEGELEQRNYVLKKKYDAMRENEVMYESLFIDDADIILIAYGTSARVSKAAMNLLRKEGMKIGMIRPITLFPFPEEIIYKTADRVKKFLVVEMSLGQMVEDVKLSVNGKAEVGFYGRTGGGIVNVEEVCENIRKMLIGVGP